MYRRPKFLEVLLEIRREMAKEADYDVVLFAENVRSGKCNEISAAAGDAAENDTDVGSVSDKKVSRPVKVK